MMTTIAAAACDVRRKMLDYLPAHHCKRNRVFSTSKNPERRIHDSYIRVRTQNSDKPLDQLYRNYLEKCWKLPYYGYLANGNYRCTGCGKKVSAPKSFFWIFSAVAWNFKAKFSPMAKDEVHIGK